MPRIPDELPDHPRPPRMTHEERFLPGGFWKAVGLLIAATIVGGTAFLLVAGVSDIDLPEIDLGELTEETGQVTTLEDITLEDTTTKAETENALDLLTSAGFAAAIDAVSAKAGPDAVLTNVQLTEYQASFIVRTRHRVDQEYRVRADSGELSRGNPFAILGTPSFDNLFQLNQIDPESIGRMLAGARRLSGAGDFTTKSLRLTRSSAFPQWTIDAEAGGNYVSYVAKLTGSRVHKAGSYEIPEETIKLNECTEAAIGDQDAVRDCFKEFGP